MLTLIRFDASTKTQKELEDFGNKLNNEFLAAHGGKAPENMTACRCDYCRIAFAKFINRMDGCSR